MSNNPDNPMFRADQLTFWQLIQKTKIEIPIIQRDYAQGRENKGKVRKSFLAALKKALEGNAIDLDFVYGCKLDDALHPLDGQQRLTTLFLLHWYFATKEDQMTMAVQEVLQRFTYETRFSSRDFCNYLVQKNISFKHLLPADDSKQNSLSKTIVDSTWFLLSWKSDPTIKAMLVMIDAIHNNFPEIEEGWRKLTSNNAPLITFQYIELAHLGLTDDLYIKMNARGKQLSPFENFKAIFEKKIEDDEWEKGKLLTEKFSHKADTTWTDIFWDSKQADKFDTAYLRFITNSAMVSIALKQTDPVAKKDREKLLQDLFNNPDNLSPKHFDRSGYSYLYDSLEVYTKPENTKIRFGIPFWQHLKTEETLFDKVTKEQNPTYSQRVLFYAQTIYLIKSVQFNERAFENWMRVIRNIVANSTIDSAETFVSATNLVSELAAGCENVYGHLVANAVNAGFASIQVAEEVRKAKLIQTEELYFSALQELEDTNFCRGRVAFALDCIADEVDGAAVTPDRIAEVSKVFSTYLDQEFVTNQFRRALLTVGDNCFYTYWWSWLYAADAEKRKLIANMDDLRAFAYNPSYKHYLKALINQLVSSSLSELLQSYKPAADIPNWKRRLILEPALLDKSHQHYIAIRQDQSRCFIIPQSKVANNKEGKRKLFEVF